MKKFKYRKSTKKRRFTRKRRGQRKAVGEARYFKMKCTNVIPLMFHQGMTNNTLVLARFWRSGNFQVPNQSLNIWTGYDNTPRWKQCSRNYQQFAVTGMSMKYVPQEMGAVVSNPITIGSTLPPRITRVCSYENLDTPVCQYWSDKQMIASSSFRLRSTKGGFSQYWSNKPLARQQKMQWRDTDTEAPNDDQNGASVAFRWDGVGFNANQSELVGYIKYTYYITFRGQRFDAGPMFEEN